MSGAPSACNDVPKRKVVPKEKVLRDPAAPKRPMSAFMLYAKAERPKIVAELGNISVGEVGKELGRRWALLDVDSKGKYETAYREEKVRYEKEKENYQPSTWFLDQKKDFEERKAGREISDMEEYFSFLQENWRTVADDNKTMGVKDVQEMTWQMWSKDKPLKKVKKTKKARDPAQPRKPLSAYFIYQQQMREELKKSSNFCAPNKEVLGMLAEKWKTMDSDMRKEYEMQADTLKAEYETKMMEFRREKTSD